MSTNYTFAADLGQEDKQKHVVFSAGVSSVSYAAFRAARFNKVSSVMFSMAISLGVGHLKESSDPLYDKQDMQANAAGAGLGLLVPMYIEF